MLESVEKRPKRKRITTNSDLPVATSNQSKKTVKVNIPEKRIEDLFKDVKTENINKNIQPEPNKTRDEEPVLFANPLPLTEKPKQTRKRKTKETTETDVKVVAAEAVAETPQPVKRKRGRPKKSDTTNATTVAPQTKAPEDIPILDPEVLPGKITTTYHFAAQEP